MTSPGAIGDGNDLCMPCIVHPPPPIPLSLPSQISTPHQIQYVLAQNIYAASKIRPGIFGNPLHRRDAQQIEVGSSFPATVVEDNLQETILQPASKPSWRYPHPLVKGRGGDPVNYRRVQHGEQWCPHSAFTTTYAFLYRHRHRRSLTDSYPVYQNPVVI